MKKVKVGKKAPNFKGLSSLGSFDFYKFCKDKWTIFFLNPCNFSNINGFEDFTETKIQLNNKGIQLLALANDFEKRPFWSAYNTRTSISIGFPIVLDADDNIKEKFAQGFDEEMNEELNRIFIIAPNKKIQQIITYRKDVGIDLNDIIMVVQSQMNHSEDQILRPMVRVKS